MTFLRPYLVIMGVAMLSTSVSGAAIPSAATHVFSTIDLNHTTAWNATASNTSIATPTATLVILSSPTTTAALTGSCDKSYWVNHLTFEVTLDEFIAYYHAKNLSCISDWLWSSDGCTLAPDKPFGVSFYNACVRHDFGYAGFSTLCALSPDMRQRIDRGFSHDLEDICAEKNWFLRPICGWLKQAYYDGVRAFGNVFSEECDTDHSKRSRGIMKP